MPFKIVRNDITKVKAEQRFVLRGHTFGLVMRHN